MAEFAAGTATGLQKVTTAGTAVQLTAEPPSGDIDYQITIQTLSTNEGTIVLGDKEVKAAVGSHGTPTQRGYRMKKEEAITLKLADATTLWMDTDKSGDGISWLILAA